MIEFFYKTLLLILFIGGLFGLNIIPKNEMLIIKNIFIRKKNNG